MYLKRKVQTEIKSKTRLQAVTLQSDAKYILLNVLNPLKYKNKIYF